MNYPSNSNRKTETTVQQVVKGTFATIIGSVGAIGAAKGLVSTIGFTASGVAGGSIAATLQSSLLGEVIAKGGAFALLQSVGAAGLGAAVAPLAIVGGVIGGGGYVAYHHSNEIKDAVKSYGEDIQSACSSFANSVLNSVKKSSENTKFK